MGRPRLPRIYLRRSRKWNQDLESVTDAKIHSSSDRLSTGTHGMKSLRYINIHRWLRWLQRRLYRAIPAAKKNEYERVYPFGWLGVLSEPSR